jgi:hypothetical protein
VQVDRIFFTHGGEAGFLFIFQDIHKPLDGLGNGVWRSGNLPKKVWSSFSQFNFSPERAGG